MNQRCHRLVFSRRHGMLMAVAENARACGKTASGEAGSAARPHAAAQVAALLGLTLAAGLPPPVQAQAAARPAVTFGSQYQAARAAAGRPVANLPTPYTNAAGKTFRPFAYDPAKGTGTDLGTNGTVSWSTSADGKTATFNQGSQARVVVNWDNFDIGAGYKVQFVQSTDPNQYVSALNRIWSTDPSLIMGQLSANREVILVNANGLYIGRGAKVDTGKFIATALNIADDVFEKGLRNVTDASGVFSTASDSASGYVANLDAVVSVEDGAEVRSAAGGDVMLIAPRVVNQGRIETNGGQAILAAGRTVYLASSADPAQRGLIVAVDPVLVTGGNTPDTTVGSVENSAAGGSFQGSDSTGALVNKINEIHADSGTVNLVGLLVRQSGRISASTSVKGQNGAIYLQAMSSTADVSAGDGATRRGVALEAGSKAKLAASLGTVEIGAGSQTLALPADSSATQLDAETFNPSRIQVEGQTITVGAGATLNAPAGNINLLAAAAAATSSQPLLPNLFDAQQQSMDVNADGSSIRIASDATLSVAGVRGVEVDGSRNQGTTRLFRIELADAPVQRDTDLYRSEIKFDLRDTANIKVANLQGSTAAIARTAAEKSAVGGTLRIETEGALTVAADSLLDVSGGSVHYSEALLETSLAEVDGLVFKLSALKADNKISRLLDGTLLQYAPAYTEGKNAGKLLLNARQAQVAGTLKGDVVVGERQRTQASARPQAGTLELGRQVGNSFYLNQVQLQAQGLDSLAAGDTSTSQIDLAQVAQGGFGSFIVRGNGISQTEFASLNLGAGGALQMSAGQIDLNGAYSAAGGSMRLNTVLLSSPTSASDTVGNIHLSGGSVLDTAGLWTNDTAGAGITDSEAGGGLVQTAGGSISLNAAHSLLLDAGTRLDVSGGAWLNSSGTLSTGRAGSLSLAIGRSPSFASAITLDGVQLRGYDFAGGGSLSLVTPQLTIAADASTVAAGDQLLTPEFFASGGFGSVSVDAFGSLRLASGTLLAPVLKSWEWVLPGYRGVGSGAMDEAVVRVATMNEQVTNRPAVSLSLSASGAADLSTGIPTGNLVVERGASILLEPGATLSLSATRNLSVGASGGSEGQTAALSAPGGTLNLSITGLRGGQSSDGSDDTIGFLGDQALWLGAGARLNVSGVAELRPDTSSVAPSFASALDLTPRVTGTVLGGGSINLVANRGYVVAQAGSQISLDGTVAELNLPGVGSAVQVAKPAGTLKVSAPEGFVLEGTVSAKAPVNATGQALADGGTLDLSVALGGLSTLTSSSDRPYPSPASHARQLLLGASDHLLADSGATLGADLSTVLDNGIGYASSALLTGSGFDSWRLGSGDRIVFNSSLALHAGRQLVLDAPAIRAAEGADVVLSGASVRIGNAAVSVNGRSAEDTTGWQHGGSDATTLTVVSPLIELVGQFGLQGFDRSLLNAADSASGQIRMMGKDLSAPAQSGVWTPGSLAFDGVLTLAAGVSYVTSGASFSITGASAADTSDAGSTLELRRAWSGATGLAPLSAFGSLSMTATTIDHTGVLHQPLGSISLDAARTLTLGAGSVTSVAATDMALLYGSSQNLSTWLLPGSGLTGTALPVAKGITLSAGHLETSPTATVNASGGGNAYAWEFFTGTGGSNDYFLTDGLYAVLPDYSDTQSQALDGGRLTNSGLGQQLVITMAGSGLAPGRYNLLPARYALLANALGSDGQAVLPQGAFLVRRSTDQGNTTLQTALRNDDGSTVVTGYLSQAGSATVGTPGERFTIETPATYNAKSEIRLTSVGSLLSDAGTTGKTPRDAGLVQVASTSATDRSVWQARIDLQGHGGVAGQLDMSASQVTLVSNLANAGTLGLSVAADTLTASQAGSVLLGGWRSAKLDSRGQQVLNSAGEPVWTLDGREATSLNVSLGSQALALQELVLAASGQINLDAGTQLASTGTGTQGAREFSASGDGAVLALSANALSLSRSGTAQTAGSVVVGDNSSLSGAQLLLDSTLTLGLASSTALDVDALALGARHLVVGEGLSVASDSTLLGGALLSSVRTAADLSLRSYTSIDFVGLQDWAQRSDGPGGTATATRLGQRLVLDAPTVRGLSIHTDTVNQAAVVDIAAQEVVLRNSSGQADSSNGDSDSRLTLQAMPALQYGHTGGLTLGPGALRLAVADATLRSGGDIVLTGTGSTSATGNLNLSAARLTAATGAVQAVKADSGTLSLATEAGSRTLGERVGQGAAVTLTGQTVLQDGVINLPGGQLTIAAVGTSADSVALRFGAGSLTSVAGYVLPGHDGFDAYGLAGSINASASLGHLAVLGTLDVSAAALSNGLYGAGDAGSLNLLASTGELQLGSASAFKGMAGSADGDRGGQLQVDVGRMASADALAAAAAAGGMDRSFSLRVRNDSLSLSQSLSAEQLSITVDRGGFSLGAVTLDAQAAAGGVVQISSRDNLSLAAGSRIDARSSRSGANGGDVLLSSASGLLSLDPTAVIDTRGDDSADGRITLRALRAADNSAVNISGTLNTANLLAGQVDIEAVKVYSTVGSGSAARAITTLATTTNATTGTLGIATIRSDSNALALAADTLLGSLGVASAEVGRVALRSGVEVQAAGNLTVSSAWLNTDPENTTVASRRTVEDAGYLTLRAAGNLNINASLSDGFTTATAAGALLSSGVDSTSRDWSLRLVAGADLTSASALAVQNLAAGSTGDLTIAGNQFVRTGAGSIELAAGRNLVFSAGTGTTGFAGQAYVAGRRMSGADAVLDSLFAAQAADPLLTEQGGRLSASAQGSISAPEATQLINNWLWRSALSSTATGESDLFNAGAHLAWWTQFSEFKQTLGSFGGGNVQVDAGGSITNLQVMAPTTGWADSRSIASAQLVTLNGGDVDVSAGGSVVSGQFFVGRGEGRISAAESIATRSANSRIDETVLAAMDGLWRLSARDSITATGTVNPTAMPSTSARSGRSGYFYSWGDAAGVSLNAAGGTVSLTGGLSTSLTGYGLATNALNPGLMNVLAPSLSIVAGADVALLTTTDLLLYPDANGQLQIWAGGGISQGAKRLVMADSTAGWSLQDTVQASAASSEQAILNLVATTVANTVTHSGIHAADTVPVNIHAEDDIGALKLVLPKAVQISAGGDVQNLQLSAQQLRSSDLSFVRAGGNIDFRSASSANFSGISLAGPGSLELTAGGDVNLGNSEGVVTTGNQANPGLPETGASIRITAAAGTTVDLSALDDQYLQPASAGSGARNDAYRALLISTVEQALQVTGLSFEQARSLFAKFPQAAQSSFAQKVLAAEFSAVYLTGNTPTTAQLENSLQTSFERNKTQVLAAGEAALAAGTALTLPGRETLSGAALRSYLDTLRGLDFADLDLDSTVAARQAALSQVREGWKAKVAASLGSTVAALEALPTADTLAQSYRTALASTLGPLFESYRLQAMQSELTSAGTTASNFGQKSLPMRLALFDQGFQAAELAGLGSFVAQPIWLGTAPLLQRSGKLELTQSSVVTERGGDISLINPGGALSVGLKDATNAKGVIAMGSGNIFGYTRDDILVNTQRIFALGDGNMALWSSTGDIDSGKGANTAVAVPPLTARRSVDGMVYERAASSSGSGLATLGSGTMGLFPAFGEIRALDAFIRAQTVVLASNVQGADNLFAGSVGGQAPVVAAPVLAVSAPSNSTPRAAEAVSGAAKDAESRPRNSLLTVDLLGLGPSAEDECSEEDRRANKCPAPAPACSDKERAAGQCK